MRVIQDDIWLCTDCTLVAVNGDYSGLSYWYKPDAAQEVQKRIDAGLDRLGRHLVSDFDSETNQGIESFSRRICDCCGSNLAGERHRFAILGEERSNKHAQDSQR